MSVLEFKCAEYNEVMPAGVQKQVTMYKTPIPLLKSCRCYKIFILKIQHSECLQLLYFFSSFFLFASAILLVQGQTTVGFVLFYFGFLVIFHSQSHTKKAALRKRESWCALCV
ncbi:UNVERIFIED_CONTAM: hypothetical protein K2H54_060101 [Gekko kuhli]